MPTVGPKIGPNAWGRLGAGLPRPIRRHSFRARTDKDCGCSGDIFVPASLACSLPQWVYDCPPGEPMLRMIKVSLVAAGACWLAAHPAAWTQSAAPAQATMAPVNDLPNPYETIEGWAKLPAGRPWGSTSSVGIDKDGKSLWAAERCGANSCWNAQAGKTSTSTSIMKFDGRRARWSRASAPGMFVFPHGIYVDRDGNIWLTDGQDNLPRRGRGAAADAPLPAPPDENHRAPDHQVQPGRQGALDARQGRRRARARTFFYQPNAVYVAPDGNIFVSEGHSSARRIHRANPEVLEGRQVHQVVRQARHGAGRVRSAARAGDGFKGPAVRGRSEQQPHPDLRSGLQAARLVGAVQPAERRVHRRERRASTSPIPSRNPSRAVSGGMHGTRGGNAASGSAARKTAPSSISSATRTKTRATRARPRASRSTPRGSFTGRKSGSGTLSDTSRKVYVRGNEAIGDSGNRRASIRRLSISGHRETDGMH